MYSNTVLAAISAGVAVAGMKTSLSNICIHLFSRINNRFLTTASSAANAASGASNSAGIHLVQESAEKNNNYQSKAYNYEHVGELEIGEESEYERILREERHATSSNEGRQMTNNLSQIVEEEEGSPIMTTNVLVTNNDVDFDFDLVERNDFVFMVYDDARESISSINIKK